MKLLDRLSHEGRVTILMVVTALAIAHVRHGLGTGWTSWDTYGDLLGSWFVHYIGLWFLVFLCGFCVINWQEVFTGTASDMKIQSLSLRFYVSMFALVTTGVVWFLARVPIHGAD